MGHQKIMELFFEEPSRNFQVREIAKMTGIPKTSAARHIKKMLKEKLLRKEKGVYISYAGNEASFFFKLYKKLHFLEKLYSSGLIEYLEEVFCPKCIILFGSFAKGEYARGSDIDLFVQAEEKPTGLDKFEKKLKHKINLFFEENMEKLSSELFNNIINGVKVQGYIKLR